MNIDTKVSALKSLLEVLSWKKVLQLLLLLTVLGLGYATYENTEPLVNFFSKNKLSTGNVNVLSRSTVNQLDKIVSESSVIAGMHIATVDFKSNTRSVVYGGFNNPVLTKMYAAFHERRIDVNIPLFSEDLTNNSRIISLINGEFVCYNYRDSIAFKLAPAAASDYVTMTCSLGIPPYYGNFAGIVTVYLRTDMTDVEKGQMRLFMQRISTLIYESNFADKNQQP